MKPAPKDPRVGRALTDVVHRHVLRGALLSADPNAVALDEGTLDAVVARAFSAFTVTAISYSRKKRSYQIAMKGPSGGGTMHLKAHQVVELERLP